jgi:arylsulfatase A-like enzyme
LNVAAANAPGRRPPLSSRGRAGALVVTAAIASCLAVSSCSRTDCNGTVRLYDPSPRCLSTGAPPSRESERTTWRAYVRETIDDDTRYTFRDAGGVRLEIRQFTPVGDHAPVRIHTKATQNLSGARQMLVSYAANQRMVSVKGTAQARWEPSRPEGPISFEVPTAPFSESPAVAVAATGYPLDDNGGTFHETGWLSPNASSRLNVSLGIRPSDGEAASADFRIEACGLWQCSTVLEESLATADLPARGAWHERTIELGRFAGKTIRLRFTTTAIGAQGGIAPVAVWGNPEFHSEPAAPASATPNVILVSLDTLRASALGLYGAPLATSPNIDRLFGREGAVFERAVAPGGNTLISHMSMFTALPVSVHGVYEMSVRLPDTVPMLAETLHDAGIKTAAFTEDAWVGTTFGFDRGFEQFLENKSDAVLTPAGFVRQTFSDAKEWLQRNRDRRFFLFVHTYEVHDPYVPPEPYASMFAQTADPDAPRHLRDLLDYYRETRFVDDELAGLIDEVERLDLADDTVVIVLADHGEEFGEHGHIMHGLHLYQENVHVPLLVRGPGVARGVRIDGNFSLMDVYSTVLELFGLPEPDGRHGRSLWQAIRSGVAPSWAAGRTVVSEHWSPFALGIDRGFADARPPSYMILSGDQKLLRYRNAAGPYEERYDLADDPAEKSPLPLSGPVYDELQSGLDRYIADCAAGREALSSGSIAAAVDASAVDGERMRKLKALGYIE